MTLATASIGGRVTDIFGGVGLHSIITFHAVTTAGADAVMDQGVGTDLRLGSRTWDTDADGRLTVTGLPVLPQTGLTSYRWRVQIEPLDRDRARINGILQLAGNSTWSDVVLALLTDGVAGGDGAVPVLIPGTVTIVDNADGTVTVTATGSAGVTDGDDGIATASGDNIVDLGDGLVSVNDAGPSVSDLGDGEASVTGGSIVDLGDGLATLSGVSVTDYDDGSAAIS